MKSPAGGLGKTDMDEEALTFEDLARFAEDLPLDHDAEDLNEAHVIDSVSARPSTQSTKLDAKEIKKQESNARNCRKYREKRRMEEQKVYKDNLALKRERLEFQEQIAALETEVQALRGQGVVDLTKENELLHKEIEKHKQYIDRIVQVTRETPLKVEVEEEQRIMKSGIESATAHIVGIMYSSVCDSSWTVANSFELIEGVIATCRYQLLPTNSCFEEATRVNLRVDCHSVPFCAQELVEHIVDKTHNMSDWYVRHKNTPWSMYNDISMTNVLPRVAVNDDEIVSCIRIVAPKDKPEKEAIFIHATKSVDLYSTAFLGKDPYSSEDYEATPYPCKLLVGTTCDIKLEESDEMDGIQRAVDFESEGLIIRSLGPSACSWTHIMTTPKRFNDKVSRILHEVPIEANGEVKQGYIDIWRENTVWFLQSKSHPDFQEEKEEDL